jgi:preprotein translocase subunit YajC
VTTDPTGAVIHGLQLAQQQEGSPLSLLIILVPFALLIWLMVVPQRKQRKRQQELLGSLAEGDEVITSGGIVGVITFLEDDLAHLEVDHDVVIRVSKSSIARTTTEPEAEATAVSRKGFGVSKRAGSADDE